MAKTTEKIRQQLTKAEQFVQQQKKKIQNKIQKVQQKTRLFSCEIDLLWPN